MEIAVCDDEKRILEEVRDYIEEMAQQMGIFVDVYLFQCVRDLEYEIEEKKQYDIIFLDVKIGGENGICVARKIKEKQPTILISFITEYVQYVFDVFDVQPCGFIKKPIEKKKLEHVFKMAVQLCNCMPIFQYSVKGKMRSIWVKDICYIMSENRKIIIKTVNGNESYYGKLDDVELTLQKFNDIFIRISKSVIINWMYVEEITYRDVTLNMMDKKETLGISQKNRVEIRKRSFNKSKLGLR